MCESVTTTVRHTLCRKQGTHPVTNLHTSIASARCYFGILGAARTFFSDSEIQGSRHRDQARIENLIRLRMASIACMAHKNEAHLQIVTALIDEIRRQDSVQTIVIQSKKILRGKSGAAQQIDVYWEFLTGVKAHKCAIEAKHWDKPVSRRELSKFRAVLEDLHGQHKGVFLASSGYQEGARNYAERHGIDVYIFPFTIEMTNEDVTFFVPKFEHIAPVFDEEWIEHVLMPKLREVRSLEVNALSPDDQTHLFDEHCAAKTVREVLHEHYLAEIRDATAHEICIRFDRPTYVETGDPNAPMLKVNGLDALFSVTSHVETFDRISKDYARGAVEFMLADAFIGQ